ncbi:hypothetical protein QFC24_006763 [Naganishia onofrii]|uniref:Uncharacterized protein n=1 Tax=Naganishia onofrii TaxID=1851511 RepID=A0ACC2WXK4_9TREE|nr:hypothetical protein QFC24_006763 [Naganishia onofrii]
MPSSYRSGTPPTFVSTPSTTPDSTAGGKSGTDAESVDSFDHTRASAPSSSGRAATTAEFGSIEFPIYDPNGKPSLFSLPPGYGIEILTKDKAKKLQGTGEPLTVIATPSGEIDARATFPSAKIVSVPTAQITEAITTAIATAESTGNAKPDGNAQGTPMSETDHLLNIVVPAVVVPIVIAGILGAAYIIKKRDTKRRDRER